MSGPSVILKLDPAALPTGSIVPNTNAAYKNVFDNAEIGKPIIMTEHPECMKPGPLDLLSQATYAEIESLLKTNELGVQRFFNAKGCSEIADALVQQRVTGTNLSMLTAANIDSDLRLDLGQRLALKNFLHRVKVVAHGKARNDTVWESESFDRREEKLRMEGMLPKSVVGLFETCTLGSNKKKKERLLLPKAHYTLTHSSLKVVTSEWTDGHSADLERYAMDKFSLPQIKTATDNIDLLQVQDVDNIKVSEERRKAKHGCLGVCLGKEHHVITEPAQVIVSYIDKGRAGEESQQQHKLMMKLHPEQVDEVSEKIIATRNNLAAEVR